MEKVVRFICCKSYDFTDQNGSRVAGISCKCFDEENNCIIKVKANDMLDCQFGDEISVTCVPNGRYVNYVIS